MAEFKSFVFFFPLEIKLGKKFLFAYSLFIFYLFAKEDRKWLKKVQYFNIIKNLGISKRSIFQKPNKGEGSEAKTESEGGSPSRSDSLSHSRGWAAGLVLAPMWVKRRLKWNQTQSWISKRHRLVRRVSALLTLREKLFSLKSSQGRFSAKGWMWFSITSLPETVWDMP